MVVVPALVPAESATPVTDSGYISGHAAEAMRDALALAYVMPERYQELISRALELGENRILAGMHSPLDVMAGRMEAEAVVAAALSTGAVSKTKSAAYALAQSVITKAAGVADFAALNKLAHAQDVTQDRFADHALNRANYQHRMAYDFDRLVDESVHTPEHSVVANVPKGAEVLLETRLPYLSAAQRRVVLKTTAFLSGYPVLDDAEGWGRLNLFAAADGYGAFNGDVTVSMDASLGGFNAYDTWRNAIRGGGKLTKDGSGTLALSGHNRYTGGTVVVAGTLEAHNRHALGDGAVYVSGGTLSSRAHGPLEVASYTQLPGTTLDLQLREEGEGAVSARGDITLAGGTLNVTTLKDDDSGEEACHERNLVVLRGRHVSGKFDSVLLNGVAVKARYTDGMVVINR